MLPYSKLLHLVRKAEFVRDLEVEVVTRAIVQVFGGDS